MKLGLYALLEPHLGRQWALAVETAVNAYKQGRPGTLNVTIPRKVLVAIVEGLRSEIESRTPEFGMSELDIQPEDEI